MKAIRSGETTAVETIDVPRLEKPTDVTIDVKYAGLCRTDVYVAQHRIKARRPLTLGHEFSGTIREAGDSTEFEAGQRVTVDPIIRCGFCSACEAGRSMACENQEMLGVDYDGAFAEVVSVPASHVYEVPEGMSLKKAAFAEPVAASTSYRRGFPDEATSPDFELGIYGRGRLAELAKRIVESERWFNGSVDIITPGAGGESEYDCAIATKTHDGMFRALLRHVRSGGTIIVKSRPYRPVKSFPIKACVEHEITIEMTNYWPFEGVGRSVLETLSDIEVDDLIGAPNSIETFAEYIRGDRKRPESPKLFLGFN